MIDSTDKLILALLQNDGKITFKEIASQLNLTTTPVYERIKRLERDGYIKSYKAILDRKKIGLNLLVFCNISLKEHQASYLSQFEKDIKKFNEVIACYHIAGMYDYLIKISVEDMDVYQYFIANKLANIKNIARVQSSFVMTEVKSAIDLPLGE
jgi:DNA-binding Lrp family transcriptional regulator